MELTFLGAADTVTGSRYLVESDRGRLLVDCGLFQGLKRLRLRNRGPFGPIPETIDAVVLTHAHLDHSGYLPVLVRDGFRGPIHATAATCDLVRILLRDAAHLQEEEATHANRHGYSRHRPALPLFTREDAERALAQLAPAAWEEELHAGGARIRFGRAGHILGAATVSVTVGDRTVAFSGDLGRPDDPVMWPPAPVRTADYMVVESTYGERSHGDEDPGRALADVVRRTAARGGTVVIPAFAVGRAQAVLHRLHALRAAGDIPDIPVFLDSPMAADVTELYRRYPDDHRLGSAAGRMFAEAEITRSVEESKAIDRRRGPMIVLSASGMATGGRVLFHLRRFAGDARNTVALVGHQAAGTRGDALLQGASTVRIHGTDEPVRAEVVAIHGMSAHADADEILAWLREVDAPPRCTWVTHGEPRAADTLRRRIQTELGWEARVPEHGQRVELA